MSASSPRLAVRPFSAPVTAPHAREDAGAGAARLPPRARRLAGLLILVVEDEIDSRELIEVLLVTEGAQVLAAGSADAGLALLEQTAPDVVLSDIGMPGKDGYWLASEVRARRPDIAAVALTAFSSAEDIDRAIRAGFDHHVAKPVDPEQLVRALARCRRRGGLVVVKD